MSDFGALSATRTHHLRFRKPPTTLGNHSILSTCCRSLPFAGAATLLALALSGCGVVAEQACDDLRGAVASSRIVLELDPVDGVVCYRDLRYITAAPGSLSLEGCTDLEEATPLSCGYTYRVECDGPVIDLVGTRPAIEIRGEIGIDPGDPLAGPVGLAYVTATHPDGWVVCEGDYAATAWAYGP